MEHVDQMQDKAHAQAHIRYTKAVPGHARRNDSRKQVQGTRASRLCVDLRDCIPGKTAQQGTRNQVQDTGTYSPRACSVSTREKIPDVPLVLPLVCSTELATREIRPSRMVKNGPNERTVVSGETCFGEPTRVAKTVARTYPKPLAAP